jgi:hypothetical protein
MHTDVCQDIDEVGVGVEPLPAARALPPPTRTPHTSAKDLFGAPSSSGVAGGAAGSMAACLAPGMSYGLGDGPSFSSSGAFGGSFAAGLATAYCGVPPMPEVATRASAPSPATHGPPRATLAPSPAALGAGLPAGAMATAAMPTAAVPSAAMIAAATAAPSTGLTRPRAARTAASASPSGRSADGRDGSPGDELLAQMEAHIPVDLLDDLLAMDDVENERGPLHHPGSQSLP